MLEVSYKLNFYGYGLASAMEWFILQEKRLVIEEPVKKNAWQEWAGNLEGKTVDWLVTSYATSSVRLLNIGIIVILTVFLVFVYYVDQTPLVKTPSFDHVFFTGVHELHRILLLIPLVLTTLIFGVWGSLIGSLLFLCIVLPRALFFSPYPDPLIRPVLFVVVAALGSLLLATEVRRVQREQKARDELAQAYRELGEAQEQLIQADRLTSLGQLSASIAHEVNNPISGVLVYTQLLAKKLTEDKLDKEKAIEYLSRMESELSRSGRLIRNLLDFARQTKPSLSLVNLNEVIMAAFNLISHSAQMQHITVVRELSPTLPEITADHSQLQQVFTNLMLNAVQAMPESGTLTLRTSADINGEVKVEVQDTGVGIPKENLRKLFTPFFSTKKEVKGVGLGLAVSYGIIQRHHGRIEVNSEEGKGSTFTVYLDASKKLVDWKQQ